MKFKKLISAYENHILIVKAMAIFAIAIVAVYSPIVFLNQSYNQSFPLTLSILGYDGKPMYVPSTIDGRADFEQNWPATKLATMLISEGKIPLWNPYIGGGTPLAVDTVNYIFSPLILGFLLPVSLWDIPLLVTLWIAGFTMFLFLRNIGLNFTSSIAGGIFYMFSGVFAWNLPHPHIPVIMFTPLILYSVEKIIQNKSPKYVGLLSVSLLLGILGAHLESLALQLFLIIVYLVYRITYLGLLHRKSELSKNMLFAFSIKRVLVWSALGFIGGLALAAFFLLPAYEFIDNAQLSHDKTTGLAFDSPHVLSPTFLPYIYGSISHYWSSSIVGLPGSWASVWGYVSVFTLFFTVLAVFVSLKNKSFDIHKYTPLFFLVIAAVFIMKTVGVPVINWIAYIPVLDHVIFTRYAGVMIAPAFAVCAAFGIHFLGTKKINTKSLGLTCMISIATILLLVIPMIHFLISPDEKFHPDISRNDAQHYVLFQLFQAVSFAVIAFLAAILIVKHKISTFVLVPLILLELFLYIPVGLSPIWMFYKSIIVLCGMAAITILLLKPNRFVWKITNPRISVIAGVTIIALFGGVLISELSPVGMFQKYDLFQPDPVTDFLKKNLDNSRIFSFAYTLGPNFQVAYKMSTIGIMQAYNVASFYSFNHNFLDQNAWSTNLGFPPIPTETFFENKKYYDFLGTKYLITENHDLDNYAQGSSQTGTYVQINSDEYSISQSFVSHKNKIYGLGIAFGTYLLQNQGNVTLTLDSVPPDPKYHRESTIQAEDIIDGKFNEFNFTPILNDVKNKEFIFSLKYVTPNHNNKLAVFTYEESTDPTWFSNVKNNLSGKLYENNTNMPSKQMAFSILIYNDIPKSFSFNGINVYENPDAFPRVYLVNNFVTVDNEFTGAQNFLLNNPDFDLRHKVILEKQLLEEWITQLESSDLKNSKSEIISYKEDKITIHTQSNSSSLLILTDTFYPGWKAYIDGVETEIYRADGLVRAVFVPAGTHTVEFSYMPDSFVHGVIISLVTITILLILYIYWKKKHNLIKSN